MSPGHRWRQRDRATPPTSRRALRSRPPRGSAKAGFAVAEHDDHLLRPAEGQPKGDRLPGTGCARGEPSCFARNSHRRPLPVLPSKAVQLSLRFVNSSSCKSEDFACVPAKTSSWPEFHPSSALWPWDTAVNRLLRERCRGAVLGRVGANAIRPSGSTTGSAWAGPLALLAEPQTLDQRLVARVILAGEIPQELGSAPDEHQQPTTGGVVLLV